MIRLLLYFVVAAVCPLYPQGSSKTPPEIPPKTDRELRARIEQFYKAYADGQFRKAEELVARDSKDAFLGSNKRPCLSFSIAGIQYSEKFDKAVATVSCEMDILMPGIGYHRTKAPVTTNWKRERGRWYWYTPPQNTNEWETPFGTMKVAEAKPDTGPPPVIPQNPTAVPGNLHQVLNPVRANRSTVRLRPDQPATESIRLTNHMPGEVHILFQFASMPGLEVSVENPTLKQGESTNLTLQYTPKEGIYIPEHLQVLLTIRPIEQLLPIKVVFSSQ